MEKGCVALNADQQLVLPLYFIVPINTSNSTLVFHGFCDPEWNTRKDKNMACM